MFEATQKDQETRKSGTIIIIMIVVVLVIFGALAYKYSSFGSKSAAPAAAAQATGKPVANADPTHDLRITDTKMDKDYSGTTAQWLVNVRNTSPSLTYSHIQYETTYGGADNSVLATNKGEMNATLGPGESQSVQFRDTLYPSGTAWYRVKITGATATQ